MWDKNCGTEICLFLNVAKSLSFLNINKIYMNDGTTGCSISLFMATKKEAFEMSIKYKREWIAPGESGEFRTELVERRGEGYAEMRGEDAWRSGRERQGSSGRVYLVSYP